MARKKGEKRLKKETKKKSILDSDEDNFRVERNDDDEIDDFYAKKNKILLDSNVDGVENEPEHLYRISSDEDDSEEENELLKEDHVNDMVARYVKKKDIDSDIEDQEDEVSDAKAWGRKRQDFYESDYNIREGVGIMSEKDKEIAKLEEEEALAIQKRLADEVDEDVFGLNDLAQQDEEKDEDEKTQTLHVDLSKLPRKKLLKMVAEESPEFQGLVDDCRDKLKEITEELLPIIELFKSKQLPENSSAKKYVMLRYNLLVVYTTNICFYLNLKAKRVNVKNHPIIKRLGQFKKFITELENTREKLLPQIQAIIRKVENGEVIKKIGEEENVLDKLDGGSVDSGDEEGADSGNDSLDLDAAGNEGDFEDIRTNKRTLTSAEEEIMSMYEDLSAPTSKKMRLNDEDDGEDDEASDGHEISPAAMFNDTDSENDEPVFKTGNGEEEEEEEDVEADETEKSEELDDERRAINYQMSKNKGLTPHRKKEYRNPRVKHRIKFRKANIRRKGQVRAMRNESGFYGGEMSGINRQVVKSVKLK